MKNIQFNDKRHDIDIDRHDIKNHDNKRFVNYKLESNERYVIILTLCLYLLMIVYAISVTMIGPLMSILIEYYKLRFHQGGLIITFQSIGGIISIALGAVFADRIKKSAIIAVAYILYGVSLFAISTVPTYKLLLGLFFILGAGTRMVDSIVNAYIADLHPKRRGFYLNILHGCFAIGALIGPLYSQYLVGSGMSWDRTFWVLGIVCIVVFAVYIILITVLPSKLVYEDITEKHINFSGVMTSGAVWILCLIMVMYVGHQSGINTWWAMYMETHINVSQTISSISLSLFWVGIILGRFICSHLTKYLKAKNILVWGNLLGGLVLTISIIIKNSYFLLISIGVTGLLTGAVIPVLVTVACDWYPQNSGTASSMIFLSGTLAQIIFPWLMGIIMEYIGFQWGIIISGVTLLGGFLISLAIPEKPNIDITVV
jgi:fucose permease